MTDVLQSLPEASFDGITFPVERADWSGGNDLAEHVAYRRPGADIEPTGRKAYRGSFVIPLLNTPALVARYGELFPGLQFDLLDRFASRPIATLVHPTLGALTAAIGEVSQTAEAGERSGVRLTVQWIEHDASVSLLVGSDASGAPTNAAQSTSELAAGADRANASTPGYQITKPTIDAQIAYLDAAPRTFTQTSDALRQMLGPVSANLALPALASASAHDAYVALVALRAGVYALRDRLIPSTQRQSFYVVPRPMADWEVALAVYGDASLNTLIRSANAVADPSLIPAGRRLVIIPRPAV